MSETVVIFRKDRTGWKDCFALFPELPGDRHGILCTAYSRLGGHCSADYDRCVADSDPAAADEHVELYEELERRGYVLSVRRRATPEMHERRFRLAAERRCRSLQRQLQGART